MSESKLPYAITWTGGSGYLNNSKGCLVSVRKMRRFANKKDADAFAFKLQKILECSGVLRWHLEHVFPWGKPEVDTPTEVWLD